MFADSNVYVERLMSFGELSKVLSWEEKAFSVTRVISPMGIMKMFHSPA